MTRSVAARVADVRRLVEAAAAVYARRARLAPRIARATGLTVEGVDLGFESLEREASDAELAALVAGAGDASHVHVILSANVFVAPLRALAVARGAAPRVTVRPSPRDPVLATAIVEAAGEAAIRLVSQRDVAAIDADVIHVYGRDETIASVRARARPGVVVRGHGAGLSAAVVTSGAEVERTADALAGDVVAFDQRGCLSPRLAIVDGDGARAERFAEALYERLSAWGRRVPRGELSVDERSGAERWCAAMWMAGRLWRGSAHAVACAPADAPSLVAPPGRHVLVVPAPGPDAVAARLGALGRFVVSVGSDDPGRIARLVPGHARLSALGRMQRPPLDGPVDRR